MTTRSTTERVRRFRQRWPDFLASEVPLVLRAADEIIARAAAHRAAVEAAVEAARAEWVYGEPEDLPLQTRMVEGGTRTQVLDYLMYEHDGEGWATVPALAVAVGLRYDAVKKIVDTLRRDGLLEMGPPLYRERGGMPMLQFRYFDAEADFDAKAQRRRETQRTA